ncbi:hypothetical protein FOZ60_014393 [Perkinsus olseni]|uniref:Uncharacterized protein n=1 Tax=Perkinsus olseni TaxID=32597 RepID=A0A7J6N7H7_PEROL|nr:hypothetical protein FOZ60_014393 [Perkinsus olseni]
MRYLSSIICYSSLITTSVRASHPIDFDESKQVLRISALLGRCGISAENVPYTITPILGSSHEDRSINADFFDSLLVKSNHGVLMSDIAINGANGSPWNCWLADGPSRPVPSLTTRPLPVHTTTRAPKATPFPTPASTHPVGSFYSSVTDESGGSLVFHEQQQTFSISIRLQTCVATAYNVPYTVRLATKDLFWVIPDYSSTNFETKLDSCNDAVVRGGQFSRLRVSSKGGSMNEITAFIVDGVEWVFELAGAPPPRPDHPTQSPAFPVHETHPVGIYQSEEHSNSVSTIEFYENLLLMSLAVNLGSCVAAARNVPYHIGRLHSHKGDILDDEFFVVPDFGSTDFMTQVDNCGDPAIHGESFKHLAVTSKQGVPMSEVTTYGQQTEEWEFQLLDVPTRPPPTTTPLPTTTTPTPTVPTKPHPSGLYDGGSKGASGELVFLQKPGYFTMHITLAGCRLYYEDIPYEMVEENGVSWVEPDYSSTSLAYTLRKCRFKARSKYQLSDLEKIEFRDAQDPNDQTLVIHRSRRHGKAQAKVFKNQ